MQNLHARIKRQRHDATAIYRRADHRFTRMIIGRKKSLTGFSLCVCVHHNGVVRWRKKKRKTQKIKERDIYPTIETWLIVYIFFPIYDCSSSFIILIVSLSRIYLFHYLPSLCSCRWLVSFFSAFSIVYACN